MYRIDPLVTIELELKSIAVIDIKCQLLYSKIFLLDPIVKFTLYRAIPIK